MAGRAAGDDGEARRRGRELGLANKAVYGLGDLTVNIALVSLSMIYTSYFLTQVAGLRPALAGLVPLVGRAVDAFTDPVMGRISDLTPWRAGRRRPYFLIGAVPYGLTFALLWVDPGLDSQAGLFAYYAGVYCLLSVAMTVLTVPFVAILPEMALGYDERTTLNTYRTVGSMFGVFAAVSIRPLADALGGGAEGFARTGVLLGVAMALPWLLVYRHTFERPGFRDRPITTSFRSGLRLALGNLNFLRLVVMYLTGRICMDLVGALLILYTTYWLGRTEDFEIIMLLFLAAVGVSLPIWNRIARGHEKAHILALGAVWWMVFSAGMWFVQPDWPPWIVYVLVPVVGVGYAAIDLMPLSMVGEVVDEDDLVTGERREGIYNGLFTFVRKLGGALGVWLIMTVLDVAGFRQVEEGAAPTETVRQTIRALTAFAPVVFLAVGAAAALRYPLTRGVHGRIQVALEERDGTTGWGPG